MECVLLPEQVRQETYCQRLHRVSPVKVSQGAKKRSVNGSKSTRPQSKNNYGTFRVEALQGAGRRSPNTEPALIQ